MALIKLPMVEAPPAVKVKILLPTVKLVTAPLVNAVVNNKPAVLPTSWLALGVAVPTLFGVVNVVGAPCTGAPSTVSVVLAVMAARFKGAGIFSAALTIARFAPKVVFPVMAVVRSCTVGGPAACGGTTPAPL